MKQEEKYQIQKNDYFLYYGETVKVVGRSPYNENDYSVENKNGSKFYAEIEELQPITINEYTLKQAEITPTDDNVYFYVEGVRVKFDRRMGVVDSISHDESGAYLDMAITDFHVLQNALCLFGVEVELK